MGGWLMERFKAHTSVIGTTGTGKTYATNRLILKENCGSLYFNTNRVRLSSNWTCGHSGHDIRTIIKFIKSGGHLNYLPDRTMREKELIYLIDKFFEAGFTEYHPFIFAVDECHLYKRQRIYQRKIGPEAGADLRFKARKGG
jgi:hypothetical protein